MSRSISRRSFLKAAGVGAAALGLAACGGSSSSSTAASAPASSAAASAASGSGKPYEGVVLHYAATDTEATGNEMQDIVKMVKEKTGIEIQFTIIPKADTGEVDKRLVSLQAGDELDIIYGTTAQLKVFYDAGVLSPLDEYAAAASYSFINNRVLHRAILWAAHDEESLHRWFSTNYNVEVHAYVKNGKYCVVNNTYEPQDTTVYTGDGSSFALHLDANEIKWYNMEG